MARAASQMVNDGRPGNHSKAERRQSYCCHADDFGLLDLRCLRMVLDAEERAYVRGYRAGLEQNARDIWAEVQTIVRNAASDNSRRRWEVR